MRALMNRADKTRMHWGLALLLALCVACVTACGQAPAGTQPEGQEVPIFERGIWAVGSYSSVYVSKAYAVPRKGTYTYNESGQVTESRESSSAANIVTGETGTYTWSDDGLSYHLSYVRFRGNFGELSSDGEANGSYTANYGERTATYSPVGSEMSSTLEYREDGTLARKVLKGVDSETSVQTYEYNEHGDLVHYVDESQEDGALNEDCTYELRYEDDALVGAVITRTYSYNNDEDSAPDPFTYEVTLHADEDGNITSVKRDGHEIAELTWTYVDHPDPLARLRMQTNLASVLELL